METTKIMITAVAILQPNDVLYVGEPGVDRHHNLIHHIATTTGIRPIAGIQGFVDHTGKFYNRHDAGLHALECGQVVDGHANRRHPFTRRIGLFSEDLW